MKGFCTTSLYTSLFDIQEVLNKMALYDAIGQNYAKTRSSDPRIVAALLKILNSPTGSTVVDIGAGTGSYALALAHQGYRILAVEPSIVMRRQASPHAAIQWVDMGICANKSSMMRGIVLCTRMSSTLLIYLFLLLWINSLRS